MNVIKELFSFEFRNRPSKDLLPLRVEAAEITVCVCNTEEIKTCGKELVHLFGPLCNCLLHFLLPGNITKDTDKKPAFPKLEGGCIDRDRYPFSIPGDHISLNAPNLLFQEIPEHVNGLCPEVIRMELICSHRKDFVTGIASQDLSLLVAVRETSGCDIGNKDCIAYLLKEPAVLLLALTECFF